MLAKNNELPKLAWYSFPWQGREDDHSTPRSAEVKNFGAIPPLLPMSSWGDA
jgi:hypothetical protein